MQMAFNLDAEAGSSDWSRNRVASLPGLLVPLSALGLAVPGFHLPSLCDWIRYETGF